MPDEPMLKCPYTGLKFIVESHGDPPHDVVWRARGCFDPCKWFETEKALKQELSIRDGHDREYRQLRCPYTNRAIKPIYNARINKWRAGGAFDPTQVFPSKERAIYMLSMRRGVAPEGLPKDPPKVDVRTIEPPEANPVDDLGAVGDAAMEKIEETLG